MCTVAQKFFKKKITLLSLLSLKKHFLFSFSLSLSGFSSFFLLPQFFFSLARWPAPSSLICFVDPARQPTLSPIADLPKPHRPVLHLTDDPSSIADLSFIVDPSSTGESNNARTVTWDKEYVDDTDLNESISKVATQCGVRGGDNDGRGWALDGGHRLTVRHRDLCRWLWFWFCLVVLFVRERKRERESRSVLGGCGRLFLVGHGGG